MFKLGGKENDLKVEGVIMVVGKKWSNDFNFRRVYFE